MAGHGMGNTMTLKKFSREHPKVVDPRLALAKTPVVMMQLPSPTYGARRPVDHWCTNSYHPRGPFTARRWRTSAESPS